MQQPLRPGATPLAEATCGSNAESGPGPLRPAHGVVHMHSFATAFVLSCCSLAVGLPAQLIPKTLETRRPATPTRPTGTWSGTASESLPDGRKLEYALKLKFAGADDALQLDVSAETPIATEGGGSVPAWMVRRAQIDSTPDFLRTILERVKQQAAHGR